MTVKDYLHQKGFEYTEIHNASGTQAKMRCPSCQNKDSFAINLESGAYQCFRLNKCGIKGSFTDFQKMFGDKPFFLDNDKFIKLTKKYKQPEDKAEPINSKVLNYLSKRKISNDTVKKFPIGYLDNAILFQYHKNGKLVNIKYRSLIEKKFWKEKDCMSTLWNQDNIQGDKLVITEGEIDVMSLKEYGVDAVSVPSGANDLTWIENDWEFLERFRLIYIAMDNDQAGQKAVNEIASRLGLWRCKNVLLPAKDVNECLIKDLDIKPAFKKAITYDLAELKSCNNYAEEIIEYKNNPQKLEGIVTSSYELTNILKGWRNEEVSVWTGQNSSGKSTFLSQESIHMIHQGKKICVGSFEMPPRKYLWWLIKQYNDSDHIPDEIVEKSLDELSQNLYVIDILGVIKEERLLEIMEFAYRKYGVDVFIIDSLMKIDLSANSNEILGEQKKFVSRLKDFASDFKSHIHLVAHPRKSNSDDDTIGKTDVAGTGDITNLADNVFVLHRFSEEKKEIRRKEGKKNIDSMLIVKKNREHGITGIVGYKFNIESKTFKIYEE
jgi:twinkle protein